MKRIAIGVDLGGTNIRVGLVDAKGKVILKSQFPTRSVGSRRKAVKTIAGHMRGILKQAGLGLSDIVGVGFGVPGPVDVERGLVYLFPNIPGWNHSPIRALFEKELGRPVFVDNDANAMALGEYLFGAGRGCRNMIAITLGTGVGGGMVLDGKLFHGHKYSAAEVGHIVINENGPRCGCGGHGCLEVYVGNGYLVGEARKRLKGASKGCLVRWALKEGQALTPELLTRAARSGDALAKQLWKETGSHLGTAMAGLVNVLNPERIVIGGGVSGAGDLLFKPLKATLARKAFPIAAGSAKLFPAKLGSDAGLVGAAALALASAK